MRGGALAGTAQFAADENSNAVSLERTVSLKAGDVLYIIINKEGTDGMGALNVTLTPATEEQSKHTASQEWSHDESSHWKTCASHLYCTEQLDTRRCSIKLTMLTIAQIANAATKPSLPTTGTTAW